MRVWERATRDLFCGNCRQRTIPKNGPVCYVVLEGISRRLIRCPDCEGEPVPNLPDPIETKESGDFSMVRLAQAAPRRTRGALQQAAKEWMPYPERE